MNVGSSYVGKHRCVCVRDIAKPCEQYQPMCVHLCVLAMHDYPGVLTSMCLESHIASRCHGKSIQVKDSQTCFIRLTNPRQVQFLSQISTICWWLVKWLKT